VLRSTVEIGHFSAVDRNRHRPEI